MKTKITVLLSMITINVIAQTNYYVDKVMGNDANNGISVATPWKTIQKSANVATPNSIVNIKAGTYYENVIINVNGTAGNTITFKNYATDTVLIDGTGTTGSTLLKITNKNYLKFENIIIQNKTMNNAQGILIETTGASTATDLTFTNISIKNINWTASATAIPTATNNAQGFIALGGNGGITNLTITDCEIYNNILGFSEALSLDGNINGFEIKNCKVHNNTNIGIAIIGNYGTCTIAAKDQSRNGVVRNNLCYNNVSLYATSGGIYIDGAKTVVVEKNICYGNGNGIELGAEENGLCDSITVKNNVVYNNQYTGIYVGGYTTATTGQITHSVIRNNTLLQNDYANNGVGEMNISKASNCVFENNIFYTNAQNILMTADNILPQANNIFNYNCWYTPNNNSTAITVNWRASTYLTFAGYKAGTAQETNSTYSNPNLTTTTLTSPNFQLLMGSSCIDAGNPATVITAGETDYNGFIRLSNTIIDMGALEYGATTVDIKNHTNLLLTIYPNPATTSISIITNTTTLPVDITILNNFGASVLEAKNQTTIDVAALIAGVYFVKIKQGDFIYTRKIIKQ